MTLSLKTESERRIESLNIIYQIKQQEFNSKDDAIRNLIELLSVFVTTGLECDINIPYPEINKTIKGSLSPIKNNKCMVFLRANKK